MSGVFALEARSLVTRATHAPLDLRLSRPDRVALVAPNATGKSSLLRCIIGSIEPISGSLSVRGRVGYAPQPFATSLFPWLTARQNIELAARALPHRASRLSIERALSVIALPRSRLDSIPEHLSGGLQQLVSLARALAFDPEILLLDEPFSALDAAVRDAVIARLDAHLRDRACALVLVSHQRADSVALRARELDLAPSSAERAA